MTKRESLQRLLEKLHPISSGFDLIRLGPNGDGGYLVPDDLEGIEACFSPGVSDQSGFEKDCADFGMKVFLADRSVDQPAETHDLFNFTKKHIGIVRGDGFMTMDDWVEKSLPDSDSDLLLQMDIEGYEYETILGISEDLIRRFRVMVIEFHDLPQLWNQAYYRLASRAFEKILETHSCVHIHPNNYEDTIEYHDLELPVFGEFTFHRNDRIKENSYVHTFPHPLDFDNCDNPHITLPGSMYKE
jgi:hypothetical protein